MSYFYDVLLGFIYTCCQLRTFGAHLLISIMNHRATPYAINNAPLVFYKSFIFSGKNIRKYGKSHLFIKCKKQQAPKVRNN